MPSRTINDEKSTLNCYSWSYNITNIAGNVWDSSQSVCPYMPYIVYSAHVAMPKKSTAERKAGFCLRNQKQ